MSFTDQFGNNNFSIRNPDGSLNDGTLSNERDDQKSNKPKANAADVIDASANGLDAITNFIAPFIGGNRANQQQQNYTPPPPTQKKVNPWLIGGILGAVALIILLIVLNNGKSTNTNK